MTAKQDGPSAATARGVPAAHAPEIYERWSRCMRDAREALGAGAEPGAILAHASARWRETEPRELAFVPDEIREVARTQRHDTAGQEFLDRIVRGEAVALRRRSDGAIVYLPPDLLGAMLPAECAAYDPYDPMLARALRRHALEGEVEEAARERGE